MKDFFQFFAVQLLAYGLITWNYRAIAAALYGNVIASDLLVAALNFTLIKKVAEAKSRWAMAGYIAGGACGSVLSIWLTKRFLG